MERVIVMRQQGSANPFLPTFSPTDYIGFVARPNCTEIGEELWLDFGQGWTGPFLVADCAQDYDRPHIVGRGIVVELGYASAKEFGVTITGGHYVRVGQAAEEQSVGQ
jgi:hypothetical protein